MRKSFDDLMAIIGEMLFLLKISPKTVIQKKLFVKIHVSVVLYIC